MKFKFCGQIFEKYFNIKFHKNLSNGSRGRMDMHGEANSLFFILQTRVKMNVPKLLSFSHR
jgi:hypothetical protein